MSELLAFVERVRQIPIAVEYAFDADSFVSNSEENDVLADDGEAGVWSDLWSESIERGLPGNLFDFRAQELEGADGMTWAIQRDGIADLFKIVWDERREIQAHQRDFFASGAVGLICAYLASSRSKTGSGSRPSESSATAASHCLRMSASPR